MKKYLKYFHTFLALLRRDLKELKQRLVSMIIDSAMVFIVQIVIFVKLFPLMGMDPTLVAPLFVGSSLSFMFFLGLGQGFRLVGDMQYSRFIDYRITLPMPKTVLFAEYITYFTIESFIITFPLMSLGMIFIGIDLTQAHWFLFFLMYLVSLVFFALLFTAAAFVYEYKYFHINLWPRRMNILFAFSTLFLTWKGVYNLSPVIAYIMLLNPVTYLGEGVRDALFGGNQFIPVYICLVVALLYIFPLGWFLARGIKGKLDPV